MQNPLHFIADYARHNQKFQINSESSNCNSKKVKPMKEEHMALEKAMQSFCRSPLEGLTHSENKSCVLSSTLLAFFFRLRRNAFPSYCSLLAHPRFDPSPEPQSRYGYDAASNGAAADATYACPNALSTGTTNQPRKSKRDRCLSPSRPTFQLPFPPLREHPTDSLFPPNMLDSRSNFPDPSKICHRHCAFRHGA